MGNIRPQIMLLMILLVRFNLPFPLHNKSIKVFELKLTKTNVSSEIRHLLNIQCCRTTGFPYKNSIRLQQSANYSDLSSCQCPPYWWPLKKCCRHRAGVVRQKAPICSIFKRNFNRREIKLFARLLAACP